MFQAQNRKKHYKQYLKSSCILHFHYDDKRDKIIFHKTTPDLQDRDQDNQDNSVQDQDRFFLVSDRSCPKTDGLRPHHWKTARKNQGTCFCRFCTRFLTRGLEGSHVGLPEHLQSAGLQFNTLPHLRNDLYCVEWDVKLYYTIPSTPCSALLGNDFGQVTHRCTQYLLCYDRMAL